jgi:hypothetical protein
MSTALAATARITFQYTVQNFRHRLAMYMAYNLVLGLPQMVDRDGIVTVLWTVGAQYVWDKLRACYYTVDVPNPPSIVLESRSGALWNPVAFATLTGAGSNGNATSIASQCTYVLRDTMFKKLRFVFLEHTFGYVGHSATGVTGNAFLEAITEMLNGVDASANAPYRWMKSRGDRFLLATGDIAGFTFDLNDKLKRGRFLE